jgi:hypothetical protein
MSMRRAAILPVAVLLSVSWGSRADEQDEPGWLGGGDEDEDEKIEDVPYPGVDPEKETGIAPLIKKAKKSKRTVVTWPGFQMLEGGGSRVFVQMLKGTTVDQVLPPKRVAKPPIEVSPPHLVYRFPKKVILLKNNLNPLITRAFDTPVDWVRMVRSKKSSYMVLKLREAEEPVREEMLFTEDGYIFFFVEFAAGDYLPEDESEDEKSSKKILE